MLSIVALLFKDVDIFLALHVAVVLVVLESLILGLPDKSLLYNNDLVKSITRSGTTFTAKNSSGTQLFTFTQQDNNTTTGTTYAAGSCPNNTTFGTNGSIKNLYDYLKATECSPNYGSVMKSQATFQPTSSGHTYTATGNGTIFINAWRTATGNTLRIYINGISVYVIPANTPGFCGLSLPIFVSQKLKIDTDSSSATWYVNYTIFNDVD